MVSFGDCVGGGGEVPVVAGAFGTAMANHLASKGIIVQLWAREQEVSCCYKNRFWVGANALNEGRVSALEKPKSRKKIMRLKEMKKLHKDTVRFTFQQAQG